jgi:Zn-dependent protease with chaperone function
MMTPETRSFYTAYRLQTSIIPVYVLTALFFYMGWYMNPLRPGAQGFMFAGVVILFGISRIIGWLGFQLSRVPRSVTTPDAAQAAQLREALERLQSPLDLRLVELGSVPFLAAGGAFSPTVWISTHSLERLELDELACLLEHEIAHLLPGCSLAFWDMLWLLAWPLGWLLGTHPPLYLASAILFAWTWLRLQSWLRSREELRADKAAVASCGRNEYARAMLRHLAEFESSPGSPLRRQRLAALGYSVPQINELLQD